MSEVTVFESSDLIRLPVSRVWQLLTDWVSTPLWMPGVDSMQPESEELAVGLRLDYVSRGHERQLAVHEVEPERLLVLHTGEGADSLSYRFELTPHAEQTQIALQISVINPDLPSNDVAELATDVTLGDGTMLPRLRQYAEAAP